MPRRLLRMHDVWTGKVTSMVTDSRGLLDSTKGSFDNLLVHVAATHAGIVNGNNRFYRPDCMADAAPSWVVKNAYKRPVLIGHNKEGAVLGRVMSAKFVDESYKYKSEHTKLVDSLFYNTDAKKRTGLYESVDWIVHNLMKDPDYTGLGYIDLGLKITNPEAIRKVLADEYLTVSVGMGTDAAICSVCHQDWAVDEKCEHRPGKSYEDKRCFLICGDFFYEEVSFVNFPADPFATTLSKNKLTDALERLFFLGLPVKEQQYLTASNRVTITDSLYDEDIQIIEETMPEKTSVDSTAVEIASLGDGVSPDEKAESLKELEDTPGAICDPDGKCDCEDWSKVELNAQDQAFFADVDKLNDELEAEIDAAVAAGELTDELVKDAKLSGEQRKKLSGSTFCGPNRSFPVPDCAHVTAARRLIGRASVSDSTKSKILACVSRKASSLGCGAKQDAQPVTPQLTDEIIKLGETAGLKLQDEDKSAASVAANCLNHYQGLHSAYTKADDNLKYKITGMHRAMGEHWNTHDALGYYKQRLMEHKDSLDIVITKEEHANLLADEAELTRSQGELKLVKDQLAAVFTNYKRGLAQTIIMTKVLRGTDGYKDLTPEQVEVKVKELAKRMVSSLKDAVTDILSELKWVEVTPSAPPVEKPQEVVQPVDDNKKVADDPTKIVDSQKPSPEAVDQEQAQRESELHAARLAAMLPHERARYIADLLVRK